MQWSWKWWQHWWGNQNRQSSYWMWKSCFFLIWLYFATIIVKTGAQFCRCLFGR